MEFADLQTSSSLTLDDGTIVTACDRCRETYGFGKPAKEPPCDTCRVELREENKAAAHVFMLSRNQCVTLDKQIIDISIPAVKTVMELWEVKNQRNCLTQVLKTFHHFLNKRRERENASGKLESESDG